MNDEELLAEFTEIRNVPRGIVLRVRLITWPHPHTPRARWHAVATFPSDTDEVDLANTRRSILANSKYFRVCTECGTRKPVGWMHSEAICQSCAEQRHGVVY
jgi:hypothetical protein